MLTLFCQIMVLTTLTPFCQIMVLTTNLVLDGEQLERGAARFFSETSRAAEGQVCLLLLENYSFCKCR